MHQREAFHSDNTLAYKATLKVVNQVCFYCPVWAEGQMFGRRTYTEFCIKPAMYEMYETEGVKSMSLRNALKKRRVLKWIQTLQFRSFRHQKMFLWNGVKGWNVENDSGQTHVTAEAPAERWADCVIHLLVRDCCYLKKVNKARQFHTACSRPGTSNTDSLSLPSASYSDARGTFLHLDEMPLAPI